VLGEPEYAIERAIVFNDDALRQEGKVLYAPVYMVMFLKRDGLPPQMTYDIGKPLSIQELGDASFP